MYNDTILARNLSTSIFLHEAGSYATDLHIFSEFALDGVALSDQIGLLCCQEFYTPFRKTDI